MKRKEVTLFLRIQHLEAAISDHRSMSRNSFGPLSNGIVLCMKTMTLKTTCYACWRTSAMDLLVPDARSSYRDMITRLQALKLDLDKHVGKGDDLLFPEAIRLESSCVLAKEEETQ